MKRLLAGLALSAALVAPAAHATNYVLTLTGDMSGFTDGSFTSGGTDYQTGLLLLTGFTPFDLEDGDTVQATVTLTGGSFTLPLGQDMFFGMNFDNIPGGAHAPGASANGNFSFDGGALEGAGCGNCFSLIAYRSNTAFSFNGFTAAGTFGNLEGTLDGDDNFVPTLDGDGNVVPGAPWTVNSISISYQVSGPSTAAVPEPGVWALMIVGFGGAGAMLRRRRARETYAAA